MILYKLIHNYFRAYLNKAIGDSATPVKILPNHNKCLIHYLDLNTNLTVTYLKSAWSEGIIGQNDIYLLSVKDNIQLVSLNFSEIFDFKRIFVITPSQVTLHDSEQNNTFLG